jgi:hypothetical protein
MSGSESPYSLTDLWTPLSPVSVASPVSTAASPHKCKQKVLDAYLASVGDAEKTTVMIRGIPKTYDQEMLLAEVEETFLPVNFLYLPPGKSKSNRSYGFVNFETEWAAMEFLHRFEGHKWHSESSKLATVGFATLQGFQQNIEFYSKPEVVKDVCKRSPWIKQY